LKCRNSIAHGEYVDLNEVNFNELYSDILAIMDDIKNRLSNSIVLEEFKNKSISLS
jgi:hypothetical protein